MSRFDDLSGHVALSAMKQLTESMHSRLASDPHAPADYADFLTSFGYGEVGGTGLSLYSGLVSPESVFDPQRFTSALRGIVLFGDGSEGTSYGFRLDSGKVISIDSVDMAIQEEDSCFESFIRNWFAEVVDFKDPE